MHPKLRPLPIQMYFWTISLVTFLSIKMRSLERLYRLAYENYPPPMPSNLSCNQRLFPRRKKIQSTTSSSVDDIFYPKTFPLSNRFDCGVQRVFNSHLDETCNIQQKKIITIVNLADFLGKCFLNYSFNRHV